MLPEFREPEKSGDGNAIFLRDPYPDDLPDDLSPMQRLCRPDEFTINLPTMHQPFSDKKQDAA